MRRTIAISSYNIASSGGVKTRFNGGLKRCLPVAQKPNEVGAYQSLGIVLSASTYSAGEAPLFPFLLKLSPLPYSPFPFNYFPTLPKCPPSPAPSVPLLLGPLPRSLLLLPAALRLLSASRGEPGASRKALLVSCFAFLAGHSGRNGSYTEKLSPL